VEKNLVINWVLLWVQPHLIAIPIIILIHQEVSLVKIKDKYLNLFSIKLVKIPLDLIKEL
jgi:hypothetical protein